MNLFDASALLAFLVGEDGSDVVEAALEERPVVSAANWSEVAQKTLSHGRDWRAASTLLLGYDLAVEPVVRVDAERAAHLWVATPSLSLADRLCLATGERLDAPVWTADRAWGHAGRVRQIRS